MPPRAFGGRVIYNSFGGLFSIILSGFYLFSDGCTDQFGGPRKRKFSRLRMEELLNETSTLSIADQYKQVDTTFKDWQGTLPQIDDILFVGFEVE